MKQLIENTNASECTLRTGIVKLHDAVKVTMGPGGHTVIIQTPKGNVITKDGVSVAKAIRGNTEIEEMGISIVREAALNVVEAVGDGTTTSIVLTNAILESADNFNYQAEPILKLMAGMDEMLTLVTGFLEREMVTPCKDINQLSMIGSISANGDEKIGAIVGEAIHHVGANGLVIVEEGDEDDMTFAQGAMFETGLIGKHIINKNNTFNIDEPIIITINDDIDVIPVNLVNLLKELLDKKEDAAIIFAKSFTDSAVMQLHSYKSRGLNVVPVKAPEFGTRVEDVLYDIAVITDSVVLNHMDNWETLVLTYAYIGRATEITISKDSLILAGGHGRKNRTEPFTARIANVTRELERETVPFAISKLKKRLASLVGEVAVITVGGESAIERKERIDRYDDAVGAVTAALEGGIIIGGGHGLFFANKLVDSHNIGGDIVLNALKKPLETIFTNAGFDLSSLKYDDLKYGEYLINEIEHNDTLNIRRGWSIIDGSVIDLMDNGIVDPYLVTKTALTNAVSIAKTILSTSLVVTR